MSTIEQPCIEETVTTIVRKYNPNYGDDRICQCGHTYYRHFDSWEHMENVGCKYCCCHDFREADMSPENIQKMREVVRERYSGYRELCIEDFIDKNDARSIKQIMEYYFRSQNEF